MEFVAVCDLLPERCSAAEEENPDIKTYTDYKEMLQQDDIDLVVVILPHDIHAEVSIACSEAGKHVVSEKPMCISVAQADAMIAAADKADKMLSVFHSRRWDGDYLAIKEVVESGEIGDIVHLEACIGNYGHPSTWWRSDKKISGGVMWDWGAHIIDWTLGLIKSDIKCVQGGLWTGHWKEITNEDHGQAIIRFMSGASADIQVSQLASVSKAKYRILGTLGGIESYWDKEEITVKVSHKDKVAEYKIQPKPTEWGQFYEGVREHICSSGPVPVPAIEARKVIAIIEAAEESAASGESVRL